MLLKLEIGLSIPNKDYSEKVRGRWPPHYFSMNTYPDYRLSHIYISRRVCIRHPRTPCSRGSWFYFVHPIKATKASKAFKANKASRLKGY